MLELYYSNFETCANCTFVPMVFNQAHVSISFFFCLQKSWHFSKWWLFAHYNLLASNVWLVAKSNKELLWSFVCLLAKKHVADSLYIYIYLGSSLIIFNWLVSDISERSHNGLFSYELCNKMLTQLLLFLKSKQSSLAKKP